MTPTADELVLRLARERGWLREEQIASAEAVIAAHGNLDTCQPRLLS